MRGTNRTDILRSSNEKVIKRRRRRRKVLAALAAFGALALVCGLVALACAPRFLVGPIAVYGESVLEEEALREAVREELAGFHAWILPKRNIALFSTARVEAALRSRFPRIDAVSVSRALPNGVDIDLSERRGAYLWCPDAEAEPCFFMDKGGFVFAEAPYVSGHPFFTFYGPADAAVGRMLLDAGEFARLIRFRDGLETLRLDPFALDLGPDGMYQVRIGAGAPKGEDSPRVLFGANTDGVAALQNLAAALGTAPFDNGRGVKKMRTIDVRFGNKVFYTAK